MSVAAAATCDKSACDYVAKHKGETVATKYLSCCLALVLTACPPPMPPDTGVGGSPGTGGAAATGGKAATGGNAATGGQSPVTVDCSGAVTKCQRVCCHMAQLGCSEDQKSCDAMCTLHSIDNRFSQDIDCRLNAKTISDAQKCGPASCR